MPESKTPQDELQEESLRLGFRDPADIITDSCMVYMARVMELRRFVGLFFNLVKTSELVGSKLTDVARDELLSMKDGPKTFTYNFSDHRQIVNEIMLSRAIESFDLYLLSILREIFNARPEMLKSESKIEVGALLEMQSRDELIDYLAERRLHELAFEPLSKLSEFILSRTGVRPFKSEVIFHVALLASEVRNLIAHNDCRVNDLFYRRVALVKEAYEISDTGKFEITDDWLRRASYTLDGIVFDFDAAVSEKYGLSASNRFGKFLYRG